MISVILPTYNNESTISLAIASILNQTYDNFELIVINDCSIDGTKEVINSFKDKRIIYIENETNLGGALSRNKAIEMAKGDFICMMDGDDISLPSRLEIQHQYLLNNPKIDLIGTNIIFFKNNSVTHFSNFKLHSPESVRFYLHSLPLAHPTWMAKRCFFKKFKYDKNANLAEDQDLLLRALDQNYKFEILNDFLLFYQEPIHFSVKNIFIKRYSLFIAQYKFIIRKKKLLYFFVILFSFIMKSFLDILQIKFRKNLTSKKIEFQNILRGLKKV